MLNDLDRRIATRLRFKLKIPTNFDKHSLCHRADRSYVCSLRDCHLQAVKIEVDRGNSWDNFGDCGDSVLL